MAWSRHGAAHIAKPHVHYAGVTIIISAMLPGPHEAPKKPRGHDSLHVKRSSKVRADGWTATTSACKEVKGSKVRSTSSKSTAVKQDK